MSEIPKSKRLMEGREVTLMINPCCIQVSDEVCLRRRLSEQPMIPESFTSSSRYFTAFWPTLPTHDFPQQEGRLVTWDNQVNKPLWEVFVKKFAHFYLKWRKKFTQPRVPSTNYANKTSLAALWMVCKQSRSWQPLVK